MSKSRECPSEKVPYRTRQLAALGARRLARRVNAEGRLADPLYVYECRCGALHLTRAGVYAGRTNQQVFQPVSAEIQIELMSDEARQLYRDREEAAREREAERALRRLPDPRPTPSKVYANRPRGLRRRSH